MSTEEPGPLFFSADGVTMQMEKPPTPSIVIVADDGTELLHITTENGRLDVTGREDRWTEGAALFVREVRRLLEEQAAG